MDLDEHRALTVLEAITEDQRVTQRSLAAQLGVALGLANLYVKRLARKGYIKCVNVKSSRIHYLITPKGVAEKARLTYEFMEHSMDLYRQTRHHLRAVLQSHLTDGCLHVAIYGTGEPAELAFISLRELGLEPVAVFDGEAGGRFLGMAVHALTEHRDVAYDLMIIASLDHPEPFIARLVDAGVPEEKLCTLRPAAGRLAPTRPTGQCRKASAKTLGRRP